MAVGGRSPGRALDGLFVLGGRLDHLAVEGEEILAFLDALGFDPELPAIEPHQVVGEERDPVVALVEGSEGLPQEAPEERGILRQGIESGASAEDPGKGGGLTRHYLPVE